MIRILEKDEPACPNLLPCGWCAKFDKQCDGILALYMNPPEEEDASQQSSKTRR